MLPRKVPIPKLASYLGVPNRTAREKAQAVGVYCKPGKKEGFVLEEDVPLILEDSKCHSKCIGGVGSGTTRGQLPEGDYAALLEQRIRNLPSGSKRKLKPKNGVVISMERGRT